MQTQNMITAADFQDLTNHFKDSHTTLVAVSKFKQPEDIQYLYDLGQRDFGENYVQELSTKQELLPQDIQWHFIGHLQSNKVKYLAPFVHLIHGVDSFKLLQEINKQAAKNQRCIDCLLQIHIAQEESKFGLDEKELVDILSFYTAQKEHLGHVRIRGLMGMASLSEDKEKVKSEFQALHTLFEWTKKAYFSELPDFNILSAGMSNDYDVAIDAGSNMVRIGSLLFGARPAAKS